MALVCLSRTEVFRCYSYVLFNNLVLTVPKMGQMSESGTFSDCKMVLVTRFFAILVYVKK